MDTPSAEGADGAGSPTGLASLKGRAFREIIAPEFMSEVRDAATWRLRWRKIANWAEGLAAALWVLSVVLTFATEYFKTVAYLSLVAGSIGVLAVALLRFSSWANKESSERTAILGRLTRALQLETLPDITDDVEGGSGPGPAPSTLAPPARKTPPAPRRDVEDPAQSSDEEGSALVDSTVGTRVDPPTG